MQFQTGRVDVSAVKVRVSQPAAGVLVVHLCIIIFFLWVLTPLLALLESLLSVLPTIRPFSCSLKRCWKDGTHEWLKLKDLKEASPRTRCEKHDFSQARI